MLSVAGLKHASFPYFSCSGNRLVLMLGVRETALRCLEDKGQNILYLHSGLRFAPKQWNQCVLSAAKLKAGLSSIFQLFWQQARVNAWV